MKSVQQQSAGNAKGVGCSQRRAYFERFSSRTFMVAAIVFAFFQAACIVGPKYNRPTVQTPPAYKELGDQGSQAASTWRTAHPNDAIARGKWWEVFDDPQLNELEERLNTANQNVAAAAANFLAARSLIRQARSQYFPTVTTDPSIENTRPSPAQFAALQSANSSSSGVAVKSFTEYSLPFDASWEPDLWGRVRNTVRANTFAAQASAADVENVRLSEEAELAADYYELRAQDSLKQLLDSTVANYQQTLDLAHSQYQAGLTSEEATAQAEAQLKVSEAQDTDL